MMLVCTFDEPRETVSAAAPQVSTVGTLQPVTITGVCNPSAGEMVHAFSGGLIEPMDFNGSRPWLLATETWK